MMMLVNDNFSSIVTHPFEFVVVVWAECRVVHLRFGFRHAHTLVFIIQAVQTVGNTDASHSISNYASSDR